MLRAANAIAMGSRSREGTSPIMLAEVRRPEVDVALWRREVPAALSPLRAWAASTDAPSFDRVVTIDPEAIAAAVSPAPSSLRGALALDVAMLLGHFVAVSGTARCRLFFGAVRDDRCRRFHVDAVARVGKATASYGSPDVEPTTWTLRDDRVRPPGDQARGSEKKNAAPSPGRPSAQILPPCRAMILSTVASPTPVPGNSS